MPKQNGTAAKKSAPKKAGSSSSATARKSSGRSPEPQTASENSMLEKFFHDALKDIYWAEKALTKALPKMKKAATSQELKAAIDEHTSQTEEHVARLEEVFSLMGKKAQAKKCDAMEGLIKEGESVVEETEAGTSTRDVGIIVASQKVEHYEIATYGSLVQLATTMGEDEVADLLNQTLEEEKETDANLTELAEGSINWQAEEEEEE